MRQFTEDLAPGELRAFTAQHSFAVANYGPGSIWVTFNQLEAIVGNSNCLMINANMSFSCMAPDFLPFQVQMVVDKKTTVVAVIDQPGAFGQCK